MDSTLADVRQSVPHTQKTPDADVADSDTKSIISVSVTAPEELDVTVTPRDEKAKQLEEHIEPTKSQRSSEGAVTPSTDEPEHTAQEPADRKSVV